MNKALEQLTPEQRRALLARMMQKKTVTRPLSSTQQRLWFMHKLDPGLAINVMAPAISLEGELDAALLERCYNEVIARHEILRSTFHEEGDTVVARVAPGGSIKLRLQDLSHLGEAEAESTVEAHYTQERAVPFDLDKGPLLRVDLIKLAPQRHILLSFTHHIISDAFSQGVLVGELAELYTAGTKGEELKLPALPLQFGDFAQWQNQWLKSSELDVRLDYWRKKLAQAPTALNLPGASGGAPGNARMRTLNVPFPEQLQERLNQFSTAHKVTPFMVTLAAYKCLLLRYTDQTDLVVGTPVAGRDREGMNRLIGPFINTLVLRSELASGDSFMDVLEKVKTTSVEAFENGDVPLGHMLDVLREEAHRGASPMFYTSFSYQPDVATARFPKLEWRYFYPPMEANLADLILLSVLPREEGTSCMLAWRQILMSDCEARNLIDGYLILLEHALSQPETPVNRLPMLAAQARQEMLVPPRIADSTPRQCIAERIASAAAKYPNAVAVCWQGQRLTYAELMARANGLAHHLYRLGVGLEAPVGVCMERTPEAVIAILAVLQLGASYVPLDPEHPLERRSWQLQDAGVRVLLCAPHILDEAAHDGITRVCPHQVTETADNAPSVGPVVPENRAYIIYTSGSTGTPKGVELTHANVLRLLDVSQRHFQFNHEDTWTLFHGLHFDFSVWELFGPLCHGARLVIVSHEVSRDPVRFYQLLCDEKVTVLNQTPSAFRQLIPAMEEAECRWDTGRYVIFGGEALDLRSLAPWYDVFPEDAPLLVNMYGITETCVHVTYRAISPDDLEQGSMIGEPLDDLSLFILDQQLEPTPAVGELFVGGAGLARGYWSRPGLTATRFIPNPYSNVPGARLYRSGDLGRMRDGGDVQYMGRADFQVQLRGFRVELGEIEAVLYQQPGIREARVLAVDWEEDDRRLVAFIVGDTDEEPREALHRMLPAYMVPAHFLFLDRFPLTGNGKVDRRALTQQALSELGAGSDDYVAPETPLEEKLCQIWQEILKVERVGIFDDFFELGGHSLLATQMVSRINEELDMNLAIAELFEETTVSGLSLLIEEKLLDELEDVEGDEDDEDDEDMP